jgi:uncharacterized protein YuzE
MIKIEYDKEVDAVYIYLKEIGPGGVSFTYPCDPSEVKGMINLDFDKEGKLEGIEIMDASKKLPKEILDEAENIG